MQIITDWLYQILMMKAGTDERKLISTRTTMGISDITRILVIDFLADILPHLTTLQSGLEDAIVWLGVSTEPSG